MRCPDRYQEPNDWKNPLDKWKTQIILYNRKKSSCHRNNHLQPSQFQCPHQLLRLPACQLFLDMFVMAFPWVVTFAPAWVTHLHPMLLALVSVSLELCLRLVYTAISTNHNWQSSVFFCWRLGTPYGHIIVFSSWCCPGSTWGSSRFIACGLLLPHLSMSISPWCVRW